MRWREITEEQHAAMLEAARCMYPDSVGVLAFNDDFCKRPLLVQRSLVPQALRRPAS